MRRLSALYRFPVAPWLLAAAAAALLLLPPLLQAGPWPLALPVAAAGAFAASIAVFGRSPRQGTDG